MQEGASSNDGRSAKIECDSEHSHGILIGLDQKVFIAAIDGKSSFTLSGLLTDTAAYSEIAYIKPGRHYVDIKYTHLGSFADGKVWFDAEAAGSYIIRQRIKGYGVLFWVEDQNTHKIVGGIPGGEPEAEEIPQKQ